MAAVGRVVDDLGAGPAGYPTFLCFQARRARARRGATGRSPAAAPSSRRGGACAGPARRRGSSWQRAQVQAPGMRAQRAAQQAPACAAAPRAVGAPPPR